VSATTKTTVKLTIDGVTVTAKDGETVLSVAKKAGIEIPALCHEAGMAAWGACRLCMIEVKGLGKLQAACTTWVAEGMVVKTTNAKIRQKRESYLKMYLSDHNSYCEAPCTVACPTHIDIPAYMALIAGGDMAAAGAVVRAELPARRPRRPDRHLRAPSQRRRPRAGSARGGARQ
jgi:hypothetical protein